ncbi:MAG: glycosyl transferase family 2 [Pseudomonadota bacterium]
MTKIHLMETATRRPDLSVVIATEAKGGVTTTATRCRAALDKLGLTYEVLVIVDGARKAQVGDLTALADTWPELTVIGQRPWTGEDAALATAARRTSGNRILILPGWPQIDLNDLPNLIDALGDHDMVSAVRSDGENSKLQSLRRGLFGRLLHRLFGQAPADPFCRVHLVRRDTLDDVAAFGVRQHFLPVIAAQRGHHVTEVATRPAPADQTSEAPYVFKPLGHMRALFDALTLYVVLTFLRRPLRFFGAIGLPVFLIGAISTAWLVARRLLGDTALADRPALIFAVMMVVLGIQIIAIGLVGEIIVFSNARRLKQYEVAEVISSGDRPDAVAPEAPRRDVAG